MTTPARARWLEVPWLLVLLPALATVALDLWRDEPRPAVWLLRALPALTWLALVAWARGSRSARALQVRVELRLAQPAGVLLLVSSGAALVQDAAPGTALGGVLAVLPWVLAVVLPVAAVAMPMTAEHERGTLDALLSTPGGARAFGRKFALGAALVVLSWLELAGTPMSGDAWGFALAGHVLAVATVPTWFLLARAEATTLGLVVLVPFFLATPVALLVPEAVVGVGILYAGVLLALLPRVARRGLGQGPPAWLGGEAQAGGPGPRRVLLREQRDAAGMAAAGLLAAGILWSEDNLEGAGFMLFCFSVVVAVLSAALAFSEPRGRGTLEVELAALPRRRVLARRGLASLGTTVLLAVVAPLAASAAMERLNPTMALAWALTVLVTWCIGVAAAVHVSSAGAGVVAGLGAVLALFLADGWGFGLAFMAAASRGAKQTAPIGAALPLALGLLGALAMGVAFSRFVKADRLQPRVVLSAALGSVAFSVLFGALAVGVP